MANTVIGASVQVEFQSVGSMRKAIKEATSELIAMQEQFGKTSPQAIAAAQRIAQLKDRIQDAKEQADLFDPGKKFQAFANAASTVASGFSAVQGAMALVGQESEDLQKTLVKVQGAMALAQGLSAVKDAGKAFDEMKVVAVNAFRAIKGAIGSTGIGLLVIALGTIVAYWDEIKEAVTGVSKEQEKLNEQAAKRATLAEKELDRLERSTETLKAQGKTEKEIIGLKIAKVQQIIKATQEELDGKKKIKDAEIAQAERYNNLIKQAVRVGMEINTAVLRALAVPLQLVITAVNSVSETLGFGKVAAIDLQQEITNLNKTTADYVSNLIIDPKETKDNLDKNISILEDKLIDANEKYNTYNKQITEGNKAASKNISDERMNAEKELTKFIEEENDKRLTSTMTATEKELFEIRKLYDEKIALAKKYNLDTDQLEALRLSAISEVINKEFSIRETGGKLKSELIVKEQKEELDNFKAQAPKLGLVQKQLTANEQNEANTRKQIAEDEANNRIELTQAIGTALGSLSDVVGRETAAGKALAIAQATINTFLGITEVWKSKAVLPEPFNTATKIAATVTTAAGGFAAVRNIAKTKVPGGGGGPTPPPPPGNLNAPLSPALSPAVQGQALNAEAINNMSNQSLRAYVMNSDIQNNNQRNAYLQRNARIG
jgi:hypothetical protein